MSRQILSMIEYASRASFLQKFARLTCCKLDDVSSTGRGSSSNKDLLLEDCISLPERGAVMSLQVK